MPISSFIRPCISCDNSYLWQWEQARAASRTSQGPRPYDFEGPWLSPKGGTMRNGIDALCSHGPSSIGWSENGSCWGTIAYFIDGEKGATLPHLLHIFILSHLCFTLVRKEEVHDDKCWKKRLCNTYSNWYTLSCCIIKKDSIKNWPIPCFILDDYRVEMLQLLSITNWLFIQFLIIHDNTSSQAVDNIR